MEYVELLKKARSELPEAVVEAKRFEIPNVKGHLQGNKTIISNFNQIADILNRPLRHLMKYVLRELGAPGDITAKQFIIGAKVSASRVNEKIRKYATEFVICDSCGKPETEIIKEGNVASLKCNACGVKHHVKSI